MMIKIRSVYNECPCFCLSCSGMGTLTSFSNSKLFSRMNHVGMLSSTVNPVSGGPFTILSPCKLRPDAFRNSQESLPPDRKRWLRSSRKITATTCMRRDNEATQKMDVGSIDEALTTKAITVCKSLPVVLAMLTAVLGGTPARAGVESTFQPMFSGLVDATANKVSPVEAILARQLARRFREMSDEELIVVLQELLKASRSSISPEDLLPHGKSRMDSLLEEESKEDNSKPVDDGLTNKDRGPQSQGGGEVRIEGPESSLPGSIFSDSGPEESKENTRKLGDVKDRDPESKRGESKNGRLQSSAPSSKYVNPGSKQENSVVRPPSSVDGTAPADASATKKSESAATGELEIGAAEQSAERNSKLGEFPGDNQDMTGILWEEWKRRLDGQKVLEPTTSVEIIMPLNAADIWRNMQTSSMRIAEGASEVTSWISENREALGGGILASSSIFCVLFIREKILSLSSGKGNKGEANLKVDRTPTKTQVSSLNQKDAGQGPWSFLEALPTSFKAARNGILGTEDNSAQIEKTSFDSTTNSISSFEGNPARSSTVPLKSEVGPVISELSTSSDRKGDRDDNDLKMRLKTGLDAADAAYGSGLDDLRSFESSKSQGRLSGKDDDTGYKSPRLPPSNPATLNGSRRSWLGGEGDVDRYSIDDSPLSGIRRLTLTPNTREERGRGGKSYRGLGQSFTDSKRFGVEARENPDLAVSDTTQDFGASSSFQSNFPQADLREKAVNEDVNPPESINQTSSSSFSRPIQVDSLAYRRKTLDTVNEIEDGVGTRESGSTKSSSFFTASDQSDGSEETPPTAQSGESAEVTSMNVDLRGSLQGKTSSISGGVKMRDEYGLEAQAFRRGYTEDVHQSFTGKQETVRDDGVTHIRITNVSDTDELNVLDEAEVVDYLAIHQVDKLVGADNHINISKKGVDGEEVLNKTSSITTAPYATARNVRSGEIKSSGTVTEVRNDVDKFPESNREFLEFRPEEVLNGDEEEAPTSSDSSAPHVPRERIHHDERIIVSTTFEGSRSETEVSQENVPAKVPAPSEDADGTGRLVTPDLDMEDVWASNATSVSTGEGFELPYKKIKQEVPEDFGENARGWVDNKTYAVGQPKRELDSFLHNQYLWVRDNDGVFIKQRRESQDRGSSRVTGDIKGSRKEAVDASNAPKRASTKGDRDPKFPRRQKQKRISSGFDYRQLYLTPNNESNSSDQQTGPITSGSRKYTSSTSSADAGKTKPIRYGSGRTL
ncbi:hypothetical protein MPTK2_2g13840 [Marchantia polymorpha subsp. ruderalis]